MALFGKRSRETAILARHQVVFYPSFGYETPLGWRLFVQGIIFNPKIRWLRQKALIPLVFRTMKVEKSGRELFNQRIAQFLRDGANGRHVFIQIGESKFFVGKSGLGGYFQGEVQLQESDSKTAPIPDWTTYSAVLPDSDDRLFAGRSQLISRRGLSVISDVDDTIKFSNVPDRRDLFQNTFARDFRALPGVVPLYQHLAGLGAAFHFVSGSPWQLFEPLSKFCEQLEFPAGSFHLKPFRIRDTASKLRGGTVQKAHKRSCIEPLLAAFPERSFVLIGDSSEQDPEIYGGLMREFPHQIAAAFIRIVPGKASGPSRFEKAFADCPTERWGTYHQVDDVRERILRSASEARDRSLAAALNGSA